MARIQVEREVKLEAGVGFGVPPMDDVVPGVRTVSQPELRLQAVYLDTPDLRLMRAGLTLRHRQERDGSRPPVGEWTLKLPGRGAAAPRSSDRGEGLLVRREFTWPGHLQSLPPEAGEMVRALRRSAPLGPVARLVTHRRRTELRDDTDTPLAEIDDDVVSVMDGRRLAARFREIEVEITDGASAGVLAAVVGRLLTAGAVRSDDRPKVVRALGPRAAEPPDVRRPDLDRDATVADVVRGAIADGFLRLTAHDPGVRRDEDPEAVHQARVATRRLRSDLRTFRDVLDPGRVNPTRAELGWVAAALGEVRDADVLTERLHRHIDTLAAEDTTNAAALLARLSSERSQARIRLVTVLNGNRYIQLLDRLAEAAVAPPWSAAPALDEAGESNDEIHAGGDAQPSELAARRARKAAGSLVVGPWRHLARAVAELGENPDDDALHEVRIRAKRLRYACEAVAVVQESAAELGRAAARLQTVLGDFHDAVVAEAWLRRAGQDGSAAEAIVIGQLITLEREAAAAGRREWRAVWDDLDKRRLRAWLA